MDEHETRALTDDETGTHLGLWDAVSIIVGIVVGTTIFKAPQMVFGNVENAWWGMFAWGLGGMLALVGSFCYAELATTYPRMGGDYVYLTRAFGRRVGFLFGWAQLTVILTGSIGAMAYVFGDYAVQLFDLDTSQVVWWAVGSIVVLTAMNLLGVICGKTTQNILSLIKVLGLGSVVVVGFGWGGGGVLASAEAVRRRLPKRGLWARSSRGSGWRWCSCSMPTAGGTMRRLWRRKCGTVSGICRGRCSSAPAASW
jgi:basic amino acid/polyamine antiporter, APA family